MIYIAIFMVFMAVFVFALIIVQFLFSFEIIDREDIDAKLFDKK